ncbi:MAG: hypothetical protein ABIP95_06640 [Pelobium sp.]
MRKLYILALLFIVACNSSINKENLIGKWNYQNYEYTNKSIQEPLANIQEQKPAIVFYANGKAEIYSSGKILSHGTFYLENKIIRYEEVLDNGIKRKIPFLIKELDENQLIFETMEAPVKRITAIKK